MEQTLCTFVNYVQEGWVRWLPIAKFTRKNTHLETTSTSPFFANYGFHPRFHVDLLPHWGFEDTQGRTFVSTKKEIEEVVKVEMTRVQDKQHDADNRHQNPAHSLLPVDQV